MELLKPLPFERVLTMPERVDRHMEYLEENHYVGRELTLDQAREKVRRNRLR
ncbi:hypothetical protein D3C73_1453840 [compost metagenome]